MENVFKVSGKGEKKEKEGRKKKAKERERSQLTVNEIPAQS